MELTEISDRIDIRLNAFEVPIEVDEYEKSLYLTRAQRTIYKQLCDVFEVNGVISNYLQPFIVEYNVSPITETVRAGFVSNSVHITVPTNIYRSIIEQVVLHSTDTKYNNKICKVLKSKIGEVQYKLDNPFRMPNNKEVIRITADTNDMPVYNYEIIIPDNTSILQYSIKYLKNISPIVLETLDAPLVIDEVSVATNTEFSDEILEKIIDLAVTSILQDKTVFNQSKNV